MLWQRAGMTFTFRWEGWHLVSRPRNAEPMNQIIYIVGLVVIVLFILGYFGLR
jgi:hypothetical protein